MNTTPKRINLQIERLVSYLGLDPSTAVWLKLTKATHFLPEINNCLVNCMVQQKYHSGTLVFGWLIWQDTTISFCEAEFHCVWQDKSGVLRDITPRVDSEKRICFVPDPSRIMSFDRSINPPITCTFENVLMYRDQLPTPIMKINRKFIKNGLLKHLS